MKAYVIKEVDSQHKTDGDWYWSNDYGWVDIFEASIFNESEFNDFDLPIGGAWVECKLVPQNHSFTEKDINNEKGKW